MLLGIKFQLETEAHIKAFLNFAYPAHTDRIEEARIKTFDQAKQILDFLTGQAKQSSIGDQIDGENKINGLWDQNLGVFIIDLKKVGEGATIHGVANIGIVALTGKPVGLTVFMYAGMMLLENLGDDDFCIDFRQGKIFSYNREVTKFTLTDLNVPTGLRVGPMNAIIRKGYVNTLDSRELICLAMSLSATYRIDFITEDYIGQARRICYKRGLLTQEDMDYLVDERHFLLSGASYEHSFNR